MKAYRVWDVQKVGEIIEGHYGPAADKYSEAKEWALCSVGVSCVWPGPVLHAHCRPFDPDRWDKHRDATPWSSGIWTVNSWDMARDVLHAYKADAVGVVDLWGRIVKFTHGWRAEWCMIRGLMLHRRGVSNVRPQWQATADALAARYACDVIPYVPDGEKALLALAQ